MNNNQGRLTRHLTNAEAQTAVTLYTEGYTQVGVAQILNVSQSSVSRVFRRYGETDSFTRRPGQGPSRSTTARQDRFLRLQTLRDRTTTARNLQNNPRRTHQVTISDQTVRNRLREHELRPRRAATRPRLTRQHRVNRLDFAREHLNWTAADWGTVLFTDESRFTLSTNDRRVRVYRRPRTRFIQDHISQLNAYGGGGAMAWGGINSHGRTDLHIVQHGTLNSEGYIMDILQEYVISFAPFIGDNFILMHDNASPHTARIVTRFLQDTGIAVMDWPARSPDLNPMEHMWDALGRAVRGRLISPETLQQLSEALIEEWTAIPEQYVQNSILSMNRRCRAVIKGRGGNTRY
jgi:transposase